MCEGPEVGRICHVSGVEKWPVCLWEGEPGPPTLVRAPRMGCAFWWVSDFGLEPSPCIRRTWSAPALSSSPILLQGSPPLCLAPSSVRIPQCAQSSTTVAPCSLPGVVPSPLLAPLLVSASISNWQHS